MSDRTAVPWDGGETDPVTLASLVLNETDPIIATVRARMLPPCTHANQDAAVGSACPDCGWVLLSVTPIDTREPRRDDIERGGAQPTREGRP